MGAPKATGTALKVLRDTWGPGADPMATYESGEDGCPGAWYRCAFADSVSKYERTLTQDGAIPNLLLGPEPDPFLLEAVVYLEGERMRHRNYWNGRISEQRR